MIALVAARLRMGASGAGGHLTPQTGSGKGGRAHQVQKPPLKLTRGIMATMNKEVKADVLSSICSHIGLAMVQKIEDPADFYNIINIYYSDKGRSATLRHMGIIQDG